MTKLGQLDHGPQFDLLQDFFQSRIVHSIALAAHDREQLIQLILRKRPDQQTMAQFVEALEYVLAVADGPAAFVAEITDFLDRKQRADRARRGAAAGAAHTDILAKLTAEPRR